MKKYIYLIALLLSFVSCGDIVEGITDKVCDKIVEELNEQYNEEVQSIKDNTNLSEEEKTTQIAETEQDRREAISEAQQDCDDII